MKHELKLRADFIAETQAVHRPASQVLRESYRLVYEVERDT